MDDILIGKAEKQVFLLPRCGNRHGFAWGATGTGKTVGSQVGRQILRGVLGGILGSGPR